MKTVIPFGGGGCCPCPELVGCTCTNVCALECRKKEGDAVLCGFPEFGEPSSPAKLYLQKETVAVSDGDKMKVCEYLPNHDCTKPACPRNVSLAYAGYNVLPDYPGEYFILTGGANFISNDGVGHSTYLVTCTAYRRLEDEEQTMEPRNVRVNVEIGGGSNIRSNGQTLTSDDNRNWTCSIEIDFVYWHGPAGQCLWPGPSGAEEPGYTDRWHLIDLYDAATCELARTLGTKVRRLTKPDDCPNEIGADLAIPCDEPTDCYGANAETTITSGTERVTEGIGCIETVPGSTNSQGHIVETLSEENTEAAAMSRADPAETDDEGWAAVDDCLLSPAFITPRGVGETAFAFRRVQVRVRLKSLIPNRTYKITIKYFRRLLGSSGPWIFYALDEVNATIDTNSSTDDYTPWFYVPNEAGWQTCPQVCLVELVPS